MWNVDLGAVRQYHHLVQDQSVITLAAWKDRIVGGTTVGGGGGSHPTAKEARLFVWNPATEQKEFETNPISGATTINDLIAAPDGLIYGTAGGQWFAFDPAEHNVIETGALPFPSTIYNSVGLGPDGRIWGLAPGGIFAIDPKKHEAALVAQSPEKITGGFALRDGAVYFIAGAAVYRYVP